MKTKHVIRIIVMMISIILIIAASEVPKYEKQMEIIADNISDWEQKEVFGLWGYTVTDLDQNGRLEIISASLQGTGMYTYIKILEVNEEGTGLTEVIQDRDENQSAPDIITDNIPVHDDPGTGSSYYIFDDMIRNGYAESYENKCAVSLKDGIWSEILLAKKAIIYTDTENFTVSFTDAAGNEIDETQYLSAAENHFGAADWHEAHFNWQMCDDESFNKLSRDELMDSLNSALSLRKKEIY